MKQIWAPWRMEYIKLSQRLKVKSQKSGCFLCLKSDKFDKNNFILLRGNYSFVIMNRFPYNPGHLMIAPYHHIGLIERCNGEEIGEIFKFLQKSVAVLKKTMKPDGFNIGINLGSVAGVGVPGHLHIHVIPRWLGDTNFMPIVSKTKIINEGLQSTYNKLKREFK